MIVDARLAAGLDQISIGLAVFDENLRLVFCNSRYPLIRGYPIELCTPGVTLAELFRYNAARGDYGNGEAEVQVAERIAQIRRNADVTVDQALNDGRILAASYRPLAAGGLITTYEDVTDIRSAELTLRRDRARYEQVTKAVSEGLYDWNIESNEVQVSERLNALFDFAEGEATASDWVARLHPDDLASYRAALRAHLTGATSAFDTEYRIRDKANLYRWVQDRGIATRDRAGRAIRLVGAVSDISIRKNAERALRDSEERYSLAMSAINEGVYDWDVARDKIFYSPNVRKVLGFTEEEMRTPRDWIQRIHPEDLPAYRAAWAAHFRGETQRFLCEIRYRHADGSIHWARQHGTGIRDANGRVVRVVGSTGDISGEKTLEHERDEARTRLSVALESMSAGFALFDTDDRLVMCNSPYRRFFAEKADPEIAAMVVPGMRFEDYVRKAFERGMYPDARSDVETYMRMRLAQRRKPLGGFELQLSDGRWLYVTEQPTHDRGLVAIYTDITDVKRREQELQMARHAAETALVDLRKAQDRLVQTEKLASLGQLTAGIAHEIKNPLNFVNNFATLSTELLAELKEVAAAAIEKLDEEKRAELEEVVGMLSGNLDKIAEHGRRADGIVKSMLAHSRGSSGDRQLADINALVDESLNLAYHGARAQDQNFNITLERDFDPAIKPIELVPQDITRVFLNLFGNGFYAVNKRARAYTDGSFRPVLRVATHDAGDTVEIRVRDNGVGIPAEIRDKLFQPFFTTKPTGEGTGLGLSISYDIVTQQHGGAIAVDSEEGVFTEFTVRLPRGGRALPAKELS
jgi:PAS domain S-box-containing protein